VLVPQAGNMKTLPRGTLGGAVLALAVSEDDVVGVKILANRNHSMKEKPHEGCPRS
jgi:hypothetical protein